MEIQNLPVDVNTCDLKEEIEDSNNFRDLMENGYVLSEEHSIKMIPTRIWYDHIFNGKSLKEGYN
ncbi:hypothetical protein HY448_00205 [Candidatus Pacearchaeota archaeon]|nr:hypothetical protein [Candidatus Pacearchaeota archaeon]